ncbi:MAG: NAD(P)(+) transhydrogenase (Re/Si-specific) subunit beta [Rickettsiaceae bacterium]|nr:NAD(P)(+) transhydrogenase (Re/Si-specific) subunit beta [Rickettsiaceae bacterium]
MTLQLIEFAYLSSAICFIFALKGLSSPRSARIGSIIGIIGMLIAVVASFNLPTLSKQTPLIVTIISGSMIGAIIARKIPMTALQQLVAGFHSFVGLSALLVAYSAFIAPHNFNIGISGSIATAALIEMSIGASIGAITFSGSIIAFGKLQGLISSREIKFWGQQYVCLVITFAIFALIYYFAIQESTLLFNVLVLLSLIIGILLIIPIGGADMPVIISMLNSYSGWAAAGIGFTLGNSLLIITGALVGASGAILSHIMCRAMNRSLFNVIFGAFMKKTTANNTNDHDDRIAKISNAEDAAFLMQQAESVIIVPGYGMAVAQSQHAIKEMTDLLKNSGVRVRFAIHPVAGRMPGHMNVLLAEANIEYEDVLELESINADFSSTDVVLVIGANDVTNPAAKTDKTSPIYGMPILDVGDAKTVLFIKRSMSPGYAGIQNELFFQENTLMLFADAKKMVEDIVKSMRE